MLNLAINRKESKHFICYYKEKEDAIVVKYGNNARVSYRNSSSNMNVFNQIMEEQVKNGDLYFTDTSSRFRSDSRKHLGRLFLVYSLISASFGAATIPIANFFELNNVVGTYAFAISGGFLVLPISNIIKLIDLTKNRMFVDNKDVINQYLQEFDNTTLSINDVHNLNICSVAITYLKANNYNNKLILKRKREAGLDNNSGKRLIK